MSLVQHANEHNFATIISKGLVLVDFSANWCGPCQMLTPILDGLSQEFEGKVTVVKIDVDESQSIALQYDISSVPTLILFKDGTLCHRSVGLKDAKALKALIAANL